MAKVPKTGGPGDQELGAKPLLSSILKDALRQRFSRISEAERVLNFPTKRLHNALRQNAFRRNELDLLKEKLELPLNEGDFAFRILSPSTKKTQAASKLNLALLIPGEGVRLEFFGALAEEIRQVVAERDQYLSLEGARDFSEVPKTEGELEKMARQMCQRFIDGGTDGVFFVPVEWVNNAELINKSVVDHLTERGVPVVLLDRDVIRFPLRSTYDIVAIDHWKAGYLLAEHLVSEGFSRPLFIMRSQSSSEPAELRKAGLHAGFCKGPVKLAKLDEEEGDPDSDKMIISINEQVANHDVLVFHNDATADQILHRWGRLYSSSKKLRNPGNLYYAGFDDITGRKRGFTSVQQPLRDIACAAVDLMFQRLEKRARSEKYPPVSVLIEPNFSDEQKRGSTRKRSK